MSTNFEPKSKSVGDLLGVNSRERIVVPTFQRGYEWVKKHVEAFWQDILKFEQERGSGSGSDVYFLGPIVVLKQPEHVILLLDGQQRLATATILLSVLRDVAMELPSNEGEEFAKEVQKESIVKADGKYSLTLGETDESFFRAAIQAVGSPKPKPVLRTHRNIQAARNLLYEKVKTLTGSANTSAALMTLRRIRQMLRSDLVMACIPVESEREAFRIFETLNDRGLRLSVPDLLLNYLMREAKPESDRKDIRAFWTDMVELMGKRDINRFLRHLWVSQYGDLKSKDLFTALREHIESQKLSSSDFVLSCLDECQQYIYLINFDSTELGVKQAEYVKNIVSGLDCQSALPFLLSAYLKLSKPDFLKICQLALIFIVRYSIIAEMDSGDMETIFFDLAKEIREKSKQSTGQAQGDIVKHIKDTFVGKSPKEDVLKTKLRDFLVSPDYAGYLIAKLANSMQTQTKELGLDASNLEHVYPKRPKDNEWGGKVGQEEFNPYLWHIGNLTMLGEKINSRGGNKEFSAKKDSYKSSELQITRQIANYKTWSIANIQDRAAKLVEPVLKVWDFENTSRV